MTEKTMKLAIAFVLALGLSGAAAAEAPTFDMPSGTFNAPLPDGYCLPSGTLDIAMKMLAEADKTNKTDISFVFCDDLKSGIPTSWGGIKTPLAMLNGHAGARLEALAQVKALFGTEAGKKLLNVTEDDIKTKTGLRELFGKDFTGTTKIEPLGSDDNAVYFGGVVNYDDGKGRLEKVACAYAITVARDNAFLLILYKEFESTDDIATLLAKVKPAVASFIAANGG